MTITPYNQTDDLKRQFAAEQATKAYKEARADAAQSFVSDRSGWFRRDPSADDSTDEARQFRRDYAVLYDLNYRTSGGNADVAKKRTAAQVSRTWAISTVNGKAALMKYAPEALYNYGPSGWQEAQWKEEKERLMYGAPVAPLSGLGYTPGRAPAPDKPASIVGGELEIVADLDTPKTGDYAIMVRTKDKDGIEAVQLFFDKYHRQMRWRPDLEEWEPYKKMQEEREEHGRNELQRGQAIRRFKEKRRALDEHYKRLHNERMDRVKKYFSWSTE